MLVPLTDTSPTFDPPTNKAALATAVPVAAGMVNVIPVSVVLNPSDAISFSVKPITPTELPVVNAVGFTSG